MRSAPRAAALALLALASPACNTGFAPQYLVDDVRILAVRAEAQGSASADVGLSDVLAVRALVANPRGRAVTVRFFGCIPRPSEALLPCEKPEYAEDPARLATEAAIPGSPVRALGTCTLGPDEDECEIAYPLSSVAEELGQGLAFFLEIATSAAFRCRVFAELPVVAIAEAEGRRQVAVKRVRVVPSFAEVEGTALEEGWSLNLNPAVAQIVRSGPVPGSCEDGPPVAPPGPPFPAGERVVCAVAAQGSLGTYPTCNATDPTAFEDLTWQWYATGGEFPEFDGVGNATGGTVDFVRPPGPFRLWAILRDNRGGVAWLRRDVGPAP